MRHYIITLIVTAVVGTTACTDNIGNGEDLLQSGEILLTTSNIEETVESRAYNSGNGCAIYAYRNEGSANDLFFTDMLNGNGWASSNKYYWPLNQNVTMDFVAVGNFKSKTDGECTYEHGTTAELKKIGGNKIYHLDCELKSIQDDIMCGVKRECKRTDGEVTVKMHHAMAGVKVRIHNNTGHLNLAFRHMHIEGVPVDIRYYPPLINSDYQENCWDVIDQSYPLYDGNITHKTGDWYVLDDEARENFTLPQIPMHDNGDWSQEVWKGESFDATDEFYMVPHDPMEKLTMVFYVECWDHETSGWNNDLLGTEKVDYNGRSCRILRCHPVSKEYLWWCFGVGRKYVLDITFNDPGHVIQVSATVADWVTEDWNIPVN